MASNEPPLLVERRRSVLTLTLNRPERLNALNDELERLFEKALDDARDDESVRAVLLTGSGSAFCSGTDLVAMRGRGLRVGLDEVALVEARSRERARLEWAFEIVARLFELSRPTVAALRGPVAGAGIGLAAACDLRLAAPDTVFVAAYGKVGLPGDWGVTFLLPRLVGLPTTRRMLLAGAGLDASAAARAGLVDEIVEDEDVVDRAWSLAAELAQGPTRAFAEMKRLLAPTGLREHLQREIDATLRCQENQDHVEGMAAFRERRSPVFGGRAS